MSEQANQSLEQLIRNIGGAWMLDAFKTPEEAYLYFSDLLQPVEQLARQRFGQEVLGLSAQALGTAYGRSPHKVRAFIQAMGESNSAEMLIMVWRILQGMEIQHLEMKYVLSSEFSLAVTLRSPYGEPDETYHSDNIDDAALVRHFGVMKIDERPILDGFYAAAPRSPRSA